MTDDLRPADALDRAIDHVVRSMTDVEQAPGLRHRVLRRIDAARQPSSGAWWTPGLVGAGAMLVLALLIAAAAAMRTPLPSDPPAQVAAHRADVPQVRVPAATPQSDPASQPAAPVTATQKSAPPARVPSPSPESIFGERRGQVRAAGVDGAAAGAAQDTNVRVEVTVSDEREPKRATPKTASLVIVNRRLGRVRTAGEGPALNVEARPELLPDGRIRLTATIEYRAATSDGSAAGPAITKSVAAIVDDGKDLIVSESAEGGAGRLRLTVRATTVK